MRKNLPLLFILAAFSARAVTVVGSMQDIFGNTAGDSVRFVPPPKGVFVGTNYVADYPRHADIGTNGMWTNTLAGGFYDAYFDPPLQNDDPIRIFAPPSDTNTYTFNQLATLAVNAAMNQSVSVGVTNFTVGGTNATDRKSVV